MKLMSKVLCIYPKDSTTEFLQPLCDVLKECLSADVLYGDSTDDDDYLEKLDGAVSKANIIVFLGHGCSKSLYGVNFNPIICEENDNIKILKGKNLILFACRTKDFIKNHDLNNAWGFGFIPTSLEDAHDGSLHGLCIRELESDDLEYFRNAIVRIWLNSLKESDAFNVSNFYKSFSFYTNKEITNCLIEQKQMPHYRIVADILYYLKEDMYYFQ